MITVGVTAVGGGVGQSVLRALSHSPIKVRIVGMDIGPMSAGLYWVDSAFLVPPSKFERDYLKRLLSICAQEGIDVLIPGSDPELQPLACHQTLFGAQGCKVIVSSLEVVQICRDKRRLYEFCRERNLPFIETYSPTEAKSQIDKLNFPVIAKPRGGSASVGARILIEPDDLLRIKPDADLVIQTYLPPHIAEQPQPPGLSKGGRLDQSNEISIQFYVGGSGEILGSFASVNRLKDGVPVEVVPEPHSLAILAASPIVQALAAKGLRGPINIQGRQTAEGVRFFEINTRYTGITGVRAALEYREVEAGIWDFYAEQEEEARCCLSFIPGLVALRYVEDTIVAKERIELVSKEEPFSKSRGAERPARVLVTGASGYLGTNLIASLLNLPEVQEVQAGIKNNSAAKCLRSLFANTARLTLEIGELPFSTWPLEGIDVVIHLAALCPHQILSPENGDFFLINTEGTRRLLEAMRRAGTTGLIFLSSQEVYGTKRPIPWSEILPPHPETAYGLSKFISEQLCIASGIRTVILRASRVYGLGYAMRWKELAHKFSRLSARGKALPVYGSGRRRMDLIHIQDLCSAVILACTYLVRNGQSAIFNVGSGQSVSVMQLAHKCQTVAKEFGLPEPAIEGMDSDNAEERDFGLEIRRAKTHLNWAPAISLEKGLHQLIEAEIRSHQESQRLGEL